MSMKGFSASFTGDMYSEARKYKNENGDKCTALQFMAWQAAKEGVFPEDADLDRATKALIDEHRIPEWATKRRAKCRELAAQKWVMDSYFKEYGIDSSSEYADTVEKAFQVVPAELTVFPFFWDTIIIESILAVPLLDIFVADTVTVNSGTAVHAQMNETLADRTIGETGEFSTFYEVNVTSTESTVKLKKFGAQVTVSDEAMRRQRIPVFARGFARYGRQIGIDMTDLALDTLLNGDTAYGGINGPAVSAGAAAATGSPVYSDYVQLFMNFNIGYEPTDLVLTRNSFIKLLSIPQFQDPLAGFKFQSTAILPEMFGLMPHRWDATRSTGTGGWNQTATIGQGGTALCLQRGRALIMYQEGGLATESIRDPREQATVVTTSWYLIFAYADHDAVRTMTGMSLPA
jgi:hypothetical protein